MHYSALLAASLATYASAVTIDTDGTLTVNPPSVNAGLQARLTQPYFPGQTPSPSDGCMVDGMDVCVVADRSVRGVAARRGLVNLGANVDLPSVLDVQATAAAKNRRLLGLNLDANADVPNLLNVQATAAADVNKKRVLGLNLDANADLHNLLNVQATAAANVKNRRLLGVNLDANADLSNLLNVQATAAANVKNRRLLGVNLDANADLPSNLLNVQATAAANVPSRRQPFLDALISDLPPAPIIGENPGQITPRAKPLERRGNGVQATAVVHVPERRRPFLDSLISDLPPAPIIGHNPGDYDG